MASNLTRRELFALAWGVALIEPTDAASATPACAPVASCPVDDLVGRFMREFSIPGIGIAIVQPGQAPLARGYGVRRLGDAMPVDAHTQFAIASNSKAFLAACFALLVDAGALGWDDPVRKHLPEFEMHDPAVSAMMTVRDLFVHRSGLPLGAGDLLQFPASDRTPGDVLHALRYLKPSTGFRAGYAYDNCLYIVAGILLERVSGLDWNHYVAERLFAPLGMHDAVPNASLLRGSNHAARHARIGPPVRGMGRLAVVQPDETDLIGPAGGISVSVTGIIPWLQVQLGRGTLPDGRRLWTEAQSAEMWKPQTITASTEGPTAALPQRGVLEAYALGWFVGDYRGRRSLWHRGTVSGQRTHTVLLPEQGIGFVVYSNTEDAEPVAGLRYALLDWLLGGSEFDWVAATKRDIAAAQSQVLRVVSHDEFTVPAGGPTLPLDRYAGRYRDAWYGDIVVSCRRDRLAIDFTHTPTLKGPLEVFGVDTFRSRFGVGVEDVVVAFRRENGAVAGLSMRALSPMADFSFDYHDLSPVRVSP